MLVNAYNASTVVRTHLAKPTPLLTPSGSRSILVDTTCPYLFSRLSRSVSLKCGGRLAMYRLVGSCSCCYKRRREFVRQSGLDRPLTVRRPSTTRSAVTTLRSSLDSLAPGFPNCSTQGRFRWYTNILIEPNIH